MSPGYRRGRWVEVVLGLLAIIVGITILLAPFAGALSFVWMLGFWLTASSLFHILGAITNAVDRIWRLILGAVDLILGGMIFLSGPATGMAFLAALVGISFLFRGLFLVFLAVGLRRLARSMEG